MCGYQPFRRCLLVERFVISLVLFCRSHTHVRDACLERGGCSRTSRISYSIELAEFAAPLSASWTSSRPSAARQRPKDSALRTSLIATHRMCSHSHVHWMAVCFVLFISLAETMVVIHFGVYHLSDCSASLCYVQTFTVAMTLAQILDLVKDHCDCFIISLDTLTCPGEQLERSQGFHRVEYRGFVQGCSQQVTLSTSARNASGVEL